MKHDNVRPVPYRAVRVWLADRTRMQGVWTGERWWSVKGEIKPARWELEERKKTTAHWEVDARGTSALLKSSRPPCSMKSGRS